MAEAEEELPNTKLQGARRPRVAMWRWRISFGLLAVILITLAFLWFSRERLAGNFIEDQLAEMGLTASYEIDRIGGTRQVISDLVVGDPSNPDFTAEQVSVILRYRMGLPVIGRVEMVRPRLYGSYRDGRLSFGTLDQTIFRDTGEPPGLPDLDIKLVDGRGLIATDYGPVGMKLQGEGELDSGFAGTLAIAAPALAVGGCSARNVSLYGEVTTKAGEPRFKGPVRLAELTCPGEGIGLHDATLVAEAVVDADFSGLEGEGRFASRSLATPWLSANGLNGTFGGVYRGSRLRSRFTLAVRGVKADEARVAVLTADGSLRSNAGLAQLEVQADVEGNGLRIGDGFSENLEGLQRSSAETLLAPLLGKVRQAFEREARGSRLTANLTARKSEDGLTLILPEGRIVGGSGATLLSVSRVQIGSAGTTGARFLGNFATGGEGMPRIVGRVERQGVGAPLVRLRMADYSAGSSRLAIPELVVAQSRQGVIGFAGRIRASGPLPGGSTQGLEVPISGNYSAGGDLVLWRRCTDLRFNRLELANLVLTERGLTLCPGSSGAILRSGPGGLRIAAGAPSLDLAGTLGDTPIILRSGPVGFAWPGTISARQIEVTLGPPQTGTQFRISNLDARVGDEIGGTFDEADVRLYGVPLDLQNAAGNWSYTQGTLAISDACFRLRDRAEPDRFEPLVARAAALTLEDNVIKAFAKLREPTSDRVITAVDIRHDLTTGIGHADLAVEGLRFDERLQPDMVSRLALGVVANAEGVITGKGRIDWTEEKVTSSGEFSTQSLDFAAAFGPVKGASGTIVFSDLLGLTTAPGQRLKVASINPGIEIFDGEVEFDLREGTALSLAGGTWPFLGGTLTIQPVTLNLGTPEIRIYLLEIRGLEAAQFIERMELANLSATGTFDGTIPLIFDEGGDGRIADGHLRSRPPGGNLSYVGELTYEDLSPIANFAFDTLRSLDYSQMTIGMDGSLTGEIVTRVRFDGVKQGAGTKSNFITRQIADLPIRFNVNIRAPFYQLITSFKAMYDPAFVRDPRDLGLLSDDGTRLRRRVTGEEAVPDIEPADIVPDEPPIQIPESETMR